MVGHRCVDGGRRFGQLDRQHARMESCHEQWVHQRQLCCPKPKRVCPGLLDHNRNDRLCRRPTDNQRLRRRSVPERLNCARQPDKHRTSVGCARGWHARAKRVQQHTRLCTAFPDHFTGQRQLLWSCGAHISSLQHLDPPELQDVRGVRGEFFKHRRLPSGSQPWRRGTDRPRGSIRTAATAALKQPSR